MTPIKSRLLSLCLGSLGLLGLGSHVSTQAADLFSFQDLAGYEKCLVQGPVVESSAAQAGTKHHRMLQEDEVIARCVAQATKLAGTKRQDLAFIKELIAATKRNAAHEMSLDLILVLVHQDIKACNDMAYFEVMQKALAHPADYPSAHDSFYGHAQKVIAHCVKDAEFKSDITEEIQSTDAYISANACKILMAQGVVKACRKKA